MAQTTYTVQKVSGGKRWEILSNGRQISKHNKKSKAVKKAKNLKDRNDTLTVKKANGQFHKQF